MKQKYFYISALLHLSLVVACIIHFHHHTGLEKISDPAVKSYAYSSPVRSATSPPTKHAIEHHTQQTAHNKMTSPNHIGRNNPEEVLLRLLHDAIAEKQSYPESAIALKQSGTVKIGFMLYPDGELKQVSLVKSSGIETIDAAAISAASSITTINHVQQYLQKPTYFTIDVEFR